MSSTTSQVSVDFRPWVALPVEASRRILPAERAKRKCPIDNIRGSTKVPAATAQARLYSSHRKEGRSHEVRIEANDSWCHGNSDSVPGGSCNAQRTGCSRTETADGGRAL